MWNARGFVPTLRPAKHGLMNRSSLSFVFFQLEFVVRFMFPANMHSVCCLSWNSSISGSSLWSFSLLFCHHMAAKRLINSTVRQPTAKLEKILIVSIWPVVVNREWTNWMNHLTKMFALVDCTTLQCAYTAVRCNIIVSQFAQCIPKYQMNKKKREMTRVSVYATGTATALSRRSRIQFNNILNA